MTKGQNIFVGSIMLIGSLLITWIGLTNVSGETFIAGLLFTFANALAIGLTAANKKDS